MTEAPVRLASTVVLMRDADGIEVWLLTRVAAMAFAAGMSVFPGGRAEDSDAFVPLVPAGSAEAVAVAFGCPPATAQLLLVAAVREVFEETGVLLGTSGADLADARADVEGGQLSFAQLLTDRGVACDVSGLRPWAHWVTPPGETRRYDTYFFLAALPTSARAVHGTSEASEAAWVRPAAALEQAETGHRILLPPTAATLSGLLPFDTVAQALAASGRQSLAAVRPAIGRRADGSAYALLPDGRELTVPAGMRAGRPSDGRSG